jgi:hemolysin activation/secretion protein
MRSGDNVSVPLELNENAGGYLINNTAFHQDVDAANASAQMPINALKASLHYSGHEVRRANERR